MISYVLLAAALLLIFFEFYLPGGIMAAGGTLVLIIALALLFLQGKSSIEILLFLAAMAIGLFVVIRAALWSIRRTKSEDTMFLETDQEGYHATSFDEKLIGRDAKALCDLHPGGYVLVERKKYSALSVAGFIEKGQTVEILSGEGETLKVKRKGPEQ